MQSNCSGVGCCNFGSAMAPDVEVTRQLQGDGVNRQLLLGCLSPEPAVLHGHELPIQIISNKFKQYSSMGPIGHLKWLTNQSSKPNHWLANRLSQVRAHLEKRFIEPAVDHFAQLACRRESWIGRQCDHHRLHILP